MTIPGTDADGTPHNHDTIAADPRRAKAFAIGWFAGVAVRLRNDDGIYQAFLRGFIRGITGAGRDD